MSGRVGPPQAPVGEGGGVGVEVGGALAAGVGHVAHVLADVGLSTEPRCCPRQRKEAAA